MNKARIHTNENNLGGKNAIRRQLLEHHNAIVYAKPTIDTQTRPPAHVDSKIDPKKKLEKKKDAFEYNEVYHSFKKVGNMNKGYIDNAKPACYDLKKTALPNNKKATNFINQEHLLHLKSQQRRIANIGKSDMERKKNLYDPVANPVYFFRRPEQSTNNLTEDFMFSNTVTQKRSAEVGGFNLSKMKNKLTKRPVSAYSPGQYDRSILETKSNINVNQPLDEKIPKFMGKTDDEEALREFKLRVIDYIIENKVYKAIELEVLREKIKVKQPELDSNKIDDLFEQINMDLDA